MKSLGPEYDQTWFDDYTGTLYGQIHKVDDQCKQLSPLGNDSFICQVSPFYKSNILDKSAN